MESPSIFQIARDSVFEYVIFTAVFLTLGAVTETTINGFPDADKRSRIWSQTCHSLPALFTGVLGTNLWRAYLDPYLPYWNYYETHDYTVWLMLQNIAIFLFVYDTCFYWSHRILHIQKPINLYKLFHKAHHYPVISLWASTATHPLEILLNVFGLHITKLFTPIPIAMHYGLLLFTHFSGVVAHDPTLDIYGHVIHHTKHNCNYSGYLTFWDWLMGTRDCDINRLLGKGAPKTQMSEQNSLVREKTEAKNK